MPISSWFDDLEDIELFEYIPFLVQMSKTSINDVRKILRKIHRPPDHEVDINNAMAALKDDDGYCSDESSSVELNVE